MDWNRKCTRDTSSIFGTALVEMLVLGLVINDNTFIENAM
jgi:hypothetical protein